MGIFASWAREHAMTTRGFSLRVIAQNVRDVAATEQAIATMKTTQSEDSL